MYILHTKHLEPKGVRWITDILSNKDALNCMLSQFRFSLIKKVLTIQREVFFANNIWRGFELPKYDNIEIMFIWITHKSDANDEMSFNSSCLRSEDEEINPKYTRVVTGFVKVSQDIHNYLS
ncbi:hypothetical protein Glove_219g23 [Diversispora epigaea]|uniref:Uncharacterized protein n=1 Tax=Diversispora epigaea TaxID=1348612 RepID=A0A397IIT6_9GLOM|nr:hypothetical protein Glove_219g23 [Diversispora epigaea]